VDDIQYIRRSKLGLGIAEAPFNPDPSPIRSPGGEKLATAEKGELPAKSPNIAQRIEEKLWNYRSSGNIAKRWLLEIISWCLSAACMTAIIVVLFVLNHKPVPTWHMGLTVPALIAILSRVASAALVLPASEALGQLKWSWFQKDSKKMWDFEIFDNASRGPWGSFMLLLRTKGQTLAALGAAITIFAMALDPFFQQIVHNTEIWVQLSENGSIPMVTQFQSTVLREFRFTNWMEQVTVDQEAQAVADKFFFGLGVPQVKVGNGTRAEIPVSCPSSNCTWKPYETLGVCSDCADVADKLEFACLSAQLDWVQSANSYNPYDNGTMCGWFFNATSAKPMLMLGYQVDSITNQTVGEILTMRALPLVTNISRRPLFDGSINYKHIRNKITDYVVVSSANGSDPQGVLDSVLRRERPRAIECMLTWCVKTIESSYSLATYTETVTNSYINTTAGPYPWRKEVLDSEFAIYHYDQNITVNPHASFEHKDNAGYGLSNNTAYDFITIFDDYLPSFATANSTNSTTWVKYKTYEKDPFLRVFDDGPWVTPINMTHHMERLATTLTNLLRSRSNENATGSSFGEETFVEVRWGWLSLPMGLLGLTLVFLVATIVRTSTDKDGVGVWKTSAIATLLYGLPDALQQKIITAKMDGTPRTRARELNVRMVPTKGWRISGNVFSPVTPKTCKPNPEKRAGWF
jgi:hypothetical protein